MPGVAATVAVLSLGLVVLRGSCSDRVPFIVQSQEAPWIAASQPISADIQQWERANFPITRFRSEFEVAALQAPARLEIRALREFRIRLNGAALPGPPPDRHGWRDRFEFDVAPWLRLGRNQLEVEVVNPRGPGLLSLRLVGVEPTLRTDAQWRVSFDGGGYAPARIADDTLRHPAALSVGTPGQALCRYWPAVGGLFLSGAVASLALSRGPGPVRLLGLLPILSLAFGLVAWLGIFERKLIQLPAKVGFDSPGHLKYVELVFFRRALPAPTESWSTFHPPLFYVVCAGLIGLRRALGDFSAVGSMVKLAAFVPGLLTLPVTALLARRLLPDDPRAQALAILFAAVLPMNLYSASYVSNEPLHTLLASLALLATVGALLTPRPGAGQLALLGVLFGLAALTKFTVLVVIPVAFAFLLFKLWRVDREPLPRVAVRLLAAGLPVAAIAGWFYLRNWIRYGDPLIANWGLVQHGQIWWQQPGFHTFRYFTRFGETLVHPYLAGFRSFWDSTYSTFWGDGFIGGYVLPADRHRFWNYDFMSLGYWVALPATVLLVAGALRGLQLAFRDPDPGRRAAFGLLAASAWTVGLAYLYLVLQLGFLTQAKATYLLVLLLPLATWFALGFRAVDSRLASLPLARAALHGWLAAFAGVLLLGFAG